MPNVEVTGAVRLYRAASVWTAGLGGLFRLGLFVDLGLAYLANSIMTIGFCFVPMKVRKTLFNLARLASFPYGTFHFIPNSYQSAFVNRIGRLASADFSMART